MIFMLLVQLKLLMERNLFKLFLSPLILLNLVITSTSFAQEKYPFIHRSDNTITSSMILAVRREKAWETLTDYMNMDTKMFNVKRIKVLREDQEGILIEHIYQAPYTFGRSVKAIIKINEVPKAIISYRLIRSDLIKSLKGNWILIPLEEGTFISHRVEVDPGIPLFLRPIFFKAFEKNIEKSMINLKDYLTKD